MKIGNHWLILAVIITCLSFVGCRTPDAKPSGAFISPPAGFADAEPHTDAQYILVRYYAFNRPPFAIGSGEGVRVDSIANVARTLKMLGNTNIVFTTQEKTTTEGKDRLTREFEAEGIHITRFWSPRNSYPPFSTNVLPADTASSHKPVRHPFLGVKNRLHETDHANGSCLPRLFRPFH